MEPRRGVHPLVHVPFADVDVAVEVDDPHASVDVRRDRADVWIADRVIAADHHREDALLVHEGHRAIDLIERLLDVRRDHEDVAGVAEVQLLDEVDAHVGVVAVVQRGDPPDRLRPEPAAGAIGGAHVERRADDRDVVLADVPDVLAVVGLEEGVDAGERRLRPAREGRDRAVLDRRSRLEAEVDATLELLAGLARRNVGDPLHDLRAAQLLTVEVEVTVALTVTVEHAHFPAPS